MRLFDFALNTPQQTFAATIGMIGAGKMANVHSKVLKDLFKNVTLKAVTSRSINSARALQAKYNYRHAYTDVNSMLDENPDINAIILAVSHEQSFQILKQIIPYKKYVLAEKPAAFSSTDNMELVKMAKEFSTEIMVAVNRRFYENYTDAYFEHLRRGGIKFMNVEINEPIWNYRGRRQFNNWLYAKWPVANSIHFVDLIRFYLGDVTNIPFVHTSEPLNIKAYLQHTGGDSFVNVIYNSSAPSGFRFYGNGVSADFAGFNKVYYPSTTAEFNHSKQENEYKPGIIGQMKYFVNAVSGGSKISYPASGIEDHTKSIQLVEQVFGL
jgi:predicted dehydrogenase